MNKNTTSTSKPFVIALLALAVLSFTAGCEKDKNDTPTPTVETGKVALLHAAFAADSLDLYVGSKKVNSKLLGYGDSLKYFEVSVGERAFELKGEDDESIVKESFEAEKDKNYSVVATNSADGETFELTLIDDDLTTPDTDMAKIRLIHLSPDAGELTMVSGETELAEGIAYQSASAFEEVDAVTTSFDIVDAETQEPLLTIKDFELSEGKIYTIWVSGLQETEEEESELKAHIFINK